MIGQLVASFVVAALAVTACIVATREWRAEPVARWRLVFQPLLVLAPTLVLLYLPPPELLDPEVWMLALVAGAAGVARGALIALQVDHGRGLILMERAPEAFWMSILAALLIAVDIAAAPAGRLDSSFVGTIELFMVVLAGLLVGRNAAVLMRSRDAPQHDL
jgi:hypothetical protein